MTDTDDMHGPWALALGMAAIATVTVAAGVLRRLARLRRDEAKGGHLNTPHR